MTNQLSRAFYFDSVCSCFYNDLYRLPLSFFLLSLGCRNGFFCFVTRTNGLNISTNHVGGDGRLPESESLVTLRPIKLVVQMTNLQFNVVTEGFME
jgi:hypothetical protein